MFYTAQRGQHDGHLAAVARPEQRLPVVLDLPGIAAHEVVCHIMYGPGDRATVFVVHGRSVTHEFRIGMHLEQQAPLLQGNDLEPRDLHAVKWLRMYLHCIYAA